MRVDYSQYTVLTNECPMNVVHTIRVIITRKIASDGKRVELGMME
jgi:hypothetical protein